MRRWFLSYTSQDLALAQTLKAALKRKDPNARIFFAPEDMRAGGFWKAQLAKEIAESTIFILLVGENGLGDWQVMEYFEALDRRAKDSDYPIILILSTKRPAPGAPPAFFLYIDQGEELYVRAEERERRRFSEVLAHGLDDQRLRALMSMRSDFLGELQNDQSLLDAHRQINLPPLREAQLYEVVSRPAEILSAKFESDRLAATIARRTAEESTKDAGALPLLSYLLDDMWTQMAQRGDGVLRLPPAAMEVGGVLAERANTFLALNPKGEDALRRVLTLKLATVREDGEATRRRARRSEFSDEEWRLVCELADHPNRLLITATPESGETYAEVAHEAIFRRWATLRHWIDSEREFLSWRTGLEADYRAWEAAPDLSKSDALLMGLALTTAQAWLAHREHDLPSSHRDFILFSLERERLEREQKNRVRDRALITESRILAKFATEETRGGDPVTGILLALEALPDKTGGTERPYLAAAELALFEAMQCRRELALLVGHGACVRSAAFNPDETRILTASDDGTARMWDAQTQAQLKVLHPGAGPISIAIFSADGTRIVTACADGTARVWDVQTQTQIKVLKGHAEAVLSAAFSGDGWRLLTASRDATARVWEIETGAQVAVLAGHQGWVWSAMFSPDEIHVVTGSEDGAAQIWELEPRPRVVIRCRATYAVRTAAFMTNGKQVLTASTDGEARIWNIETNASMAAPKSASDGPRQITEPHAVFHGHDGQLRSAVSNPVGTQVLTASVDKTVRIWDVATQAQIAVLKGHADRVLNVALNSSATRAITASADLTVRIWNIEAPAVPMIANARLLGRTRPDRHSNIVNSATFSPDATRVVTASDDTTARIWNVATGRYVCALRGHRQRVYSACFSTDGARVLTASVDRTARIWDVETQALIAILSGHAHRVRKAAFSPDGSRIVTASDDGTARIWDAQTQSQVGLLEGHEGEVLGAAFSPDNLRVVTWSRDTTARIWCARTHNQIAILRGHTHRVLSAMFSSNGEQLLTASWDNTVRLWNAKSYAETAVLKQYDQQINEAVFSPDGKRVAVACSDDKAEILDSETGACVAVLEGHYSSVMSAAFSPDGCFMVTASADETAGIWRVFPGMQELVDHSKKVVPRALTREQRERAFLDPRTTGMVRAVGEVAVPHPGLEGLAALQTRQR